MEKRRPLPWSRAAGGDLALLPRIHEGASINSELFFDALALRETTRSGLRAVFLRD
jgi:hypothetical protein